MWPPGSAETVCTVCPRQPLTVNFDRSILKLVCESHPRWETFLPNLGTLGLWVLELFAMYETDGRTDGRTKATLIAPFPTVRGTTTLFKKLVATITEQNKTYAQRAQTSAPMPKFQPSDPGFQSGLPDYPAIRIGIPDHLVDGLIRRVPKCCGFIILSTSVISPSFIKIGR